MSLDKAIAHGKEHRKPYRGSKAIDPLCRNHNWCPYCRENRTHKFRDKHPQEPGDEIPDETQEQECEIQDKAQVKEASYADEG